MNPDENRQSTADGVQENSDRRPEFRADLREYEQIKFDLADLVREASAHASEEKDQDLNLEFRSLLKRLAEDRFYLTLAGQFSRGKTTLINAMLGMDRLPTGIVPVTSVITAVSYNTHERVVLHFEDSHLTLDISLDELPEWITEQGNPGNKQKVRMAEVQLPADVLRRGAFLVDTPGLGSAVIENTETTRRFLPQIDALLLVTSFEFPLSSDELAFLHAARSMGRRMFVIVNKLDLCSLVQRDQVLEFIRSRLDEQFGNRDVPIFALSASQALAARLGHDNERLDHSGLPAFERALVDYLVTEKARDFLSATCDHLEILLDRLGPLDVDALRGRLHELRSNISDHSASPHGCAARSHFEEPATSQGRQEIDRCPICARMAEATYGFLRQFQYDLSCRMEAQVAHASANGFCAMHTWQYFRLASPQGISSGYPRTLSFLVDRLQDIATGNTSREGLKREFAKILPNEQKCRACQSAVAAEQLAIAEVLRASDRPRTQERNSFPCLCLAHLSVIVPEIRDAKVANKLTEYAARVLNRLGENMQRFALQHGGLHQEQITDEELRSPELGLNLLVGPVNVRPSKGH